jgi:glycosyltransferase involved in cell wall biosynthesis
MNNSLQFTQHIAAVIPSLNPDHKLAVTVSSLCKSGFRHIIIVNDGSGEEHLANFPADSDTVTLLHHEKNRGKGAALKTAFAYVTAHLPEIKAVVTVDADGQHKSDDALSVALNTLYNGTVSLGSRNFKQPHVPRRSKAGNKAMSIAFRVLFGLKIHDTQTGLRAFPRDMLEQLCRVDGDRFEYETNQLLDFKKSRVKYEHIPIETVYCEENHTSHFRSFVDSFRIFKVIFTFVMSSILAVIIDNGLFYLIVWLFPLLFGAGENTVYYIAYATARVISSFVNYSVNLKVVFADKDRETARGAVFRYYTLALCVLAAGMGMFYAVDLLVRITNAFMATIIKMAIEAVIFFASFRFQHNWVFRTKESNKA